MAVSLVNAFVRGAKQLFPWPGTVGTGQVRSYYVNWRMLRDVKRRKMAFEYADERLRINALRKNTILPKELQNIVKRGCTPEGIMALKKKQRTRRMTVTQTT